MDTPLKDLVNQYLSDLNPRSGETPSQIEVRARRIKKNHDAILRQIVTDFENVSDENDIDGGAPDSVYLVSQIHDGGSID
jgi:hypothetical protein